MPVTTGPFPTFLPGVTPGGGTAVSDNFNRDNSTGLGSNWTALFGKTSLDVVSNEAKAGGNDRGNYWSANIFSNNQYSECYDKMGGGGTTINPLVRVSASANTYYYAAGGSYWDEELQENVSTLSITKVVNGTSTGLNSIVVMPGDVIKLAVSGTNLTATCYVGHGGSESGRVTATDSSISSGYPGIYSVYINNRIDDFYGGDL